MGWLVLSRRRNQQVVITVPPSTAPQRIVVSVVEVRTDEKARLGFLADKSIAVHRSELVNGCGSVTEDAA